MDTKKKSIFYIIVDLVMLVLFVLFIPAMLRKTLGFDVIVYEDWLGQLSSTRGYNFGAGSAEFFIIVVKLAAFIIAQRRLLRGGDVRQLRLAVAAHIVIGILGFVYYFVFADGGNLIYIIQTILNH